jgi:RNA recognition motif-containing protein
MNIYVGNLDFKVEENTRVELFEEFGTINSSKIITDKFTGRSKGFGFITMEDKNEANNAIKELNGTVLNDREITVNEARPTKNRY